MPVLDVGWLGCRGRHVQIRIWRYAVVEFMYHTLSQPNALLSIRNVAFHNQKGDPNDRENKNVYPVNSMNCLLHLDWICSCFWFHKNGGQCQCRDDEARHYAVYQRLRSAHFLTVLRQHCLEDICFDFHASFHVDSLPIFQSVDEILGGAR